MPLRIPYHARSIYDGQYCTETCSTCSTYKAVAGQVAKSGYRPDLREAAVARVSAVRQSQREPKPEPPRKLRGPKAKKAAEAS